MSAVRSELLRVLVEASLFDAERSLPRPAPKCCEHRQVCWRGIEHRAPLDEKAHVSLPWIGPHYSAGGIAALGINMNSHGGLDANEELIAAAATELSKGVKRVSFGDPKWSTPLYYLLATWAKAALAALDPAHATLALHLVFRYISYLNHVACSPVQDDSHDKSKPTAAMWQHCGPHLLRPFLEHLRPKILLVLGTSDNAPALLRVYADRAVKRVDGTRRWTDAWRVSDGPFVIAVPHPTSWGVRVADVAVAVSELVAGHCRDGADEPTSLLRR